MSNESNESNSAEDIFNSGFNCAQAVLASHCEKYGLDKEHALKISCGFGGGMGHIGEVCGAVTGALMLIGLKYGKYKADDNKASEKTYALVKEFTENFKAKYGSIKCKDLIKYDISYKEELLKAYEAGVFGEICPEIVSDAEELVEEILDR